MGATPLRIPAEWPKATQAAGGALPRPGGARTHRAVLGRFKHLAICIYIHTFIHIHYLHTYITYIYYLRTYITSLPAPATQRSRVHNVTTSTRTTGTTSTRTTSATGTQATASTRTITSAATSTTSFRTTSATSATASATSATASATTTTTTTTL